jgi:hypothetical protein
LGLKQSKSVVINHKYLINHISIKM